MSFLILILASKITGKSPGKAGQVSQSMEREVDASQVYSNKLLATKEGAPVTTTDLRLVKDRLSECLKSIF